MTKSKKRKNNKSRKKYITLLLTILVISGIIYIFTKNNLPNIVKVDKCIVIDAGHGGKEEPGCIFDNIYEKDICLEISKKLQLKLKKEYKKVIMTRSIDKNVNLKERPIIANNENADIFISIHQNALENDNITSGIETWYNPKNIAKSKTLAQTIQTNIVKATQAKNLGIKESTGLIVIKDTKMPSCLVETGFLSSSEERKKLKTPSYQDKIVEGIYNGIKAYFEEENE